MSVGFVCVSVCEIYSLVGGFFSHVERGIDKKPAFHTLSYSFVYAKHVIIYLSCRGGKGRMEVYVEYVLIENLLIDYMLISGAGLIVRKRRSRLRCVFAAIFGAGFSVLFPLLKLGGVLCFLLKIAAGIVMVFIAFDFKNLGEVLYCFLFFLLLTYAAGGAIIGGCLLFGGDFDFADGGLAYTASSCVLPYGIIISLSFIVTETVVCVLKKASIKRDLEGYYREVMIIDGQNATPVLTGFVDTGNKLYDEKSGAPVAVISSAKADELILSGALSLTGARYQTYSTVSGEGKILLFSVSKLLIYSGDKRNRIDNAIVGVGGRIADGVVVLIPAAMSIF